MSYNPTPGNRPSSASQSTTDDSRVDTECFYQHPGRAEASQTVIRSGYEVNIPLLATTLAHIREANSGLHWRTATQRLDVVPKTSRHRLSAVTLMRPPPHERCAPLFDERKLTYGRLRSDESLMASIMGASSFGPLLSIVGWTFIPGFATSLVLQGFYACFPTQRPTPVGAKPGPETVAALNVRARHHHSLAFMLVIVGYLVYTLTSAYRGLATDACHYRMLGLAVKPFDTIPTEQWDTQLKQYWRALVKQMHPDKAGPQGEEAFVAMRLAYETLSDPFKKDAYDRFGQDVVLRCDADCKTQRDYIMNGLLSSAPFYVVVVGTLLFLGMIKDRDHATYWRYVFLAGIAALEIATVTRSLNWPIAAAAWAGLLPFHLVIFLHHVYVALSMAVTQLGPLFFPRPPSDHSLGNALMPMAGNMRQLALEMDAEAMLLSRSDMHPLLSSNEKADTRTMKFIKDAMLDQLIDAAVRADAEGAVAWRNALATSAQNGLSEVKKEEGEEEHGDLSALDELQDDSERIFDESLANANSDSEAEEHASPAVRS